GQRPNVQCDLTEVDLLSGDRLLLCTDGLWGVLDPAQIAALAQRGSADEAADALIAAANARGGPDNIGVAVIGYGRTTRGATRQSAAPPSAPTRSRRVAAGSVGLADRLQEMNPLALMAVLFVAGAMLGAAVGLVPRGGSGPPKPSPTAARPATRANA